MKKITLILYLIFSSSLWSQEITLNHNIGNTIIDQLFNFTCSGGGVNWAREFVLEDFDISGEYTIAAGSFAIEESNGAPGQGVIVNVYEIDADFPDSFDESLLLGSSDMIDIPSFTNNVIFSFDFPTPIIVSSEVEKILVEVSLAFQDQNVFIGGTEESNDSSWFKSPYESCVGEPDIYQTTVQLGRPNLNYYITITGEHILGLDDISKESIAIIQNPVENELLIDVPTELTFDEMRIYDINGKTMFRTNSIGNLNVSHFSSGLYFLTLRTANGFISKKFIKQ